MSAATPPLPAGARALRLAGHELLMLPQRALWWPARRLLLLSDVHLGKGDVLRAGGIPVPSGTGAADLARLSALIDATGAGAVWVLGDLLHGPMAGAGWQRAWHLLRARHDATSFALVAGNHDRRVDTAALGIEPLPPCVCVDGLELAHAPRADAPPAPARSTSAQSASAQSPSTRSTDERSTSTPDAPAPRVCGHLHPVVRVPGLPGRHPAFVLHDGQLVLPAFSLLTGGGPDIAGTAWACIADQVLPALARPSPRRRPRPVRR